MKGSVSLASSDSRRNRGAAVDYRAAFHNAPTGLAIARNRVILDANKIFMETFRGTAQSLLQQSFKLLYPTQEDFERTGRRVSPLLGRNGWYGDDRIMKRMDGELFWCHVTGFAVNRRDPFAETIWGFTDLSRDRRVISPIRGSLTPRERDIAALLIEGKTSKEIGKTLSISPRTVDIHRANLLRKYSVDNTSVLVEKLLIA